MTIGLGDAEADIAPAPRSPVDAAMAAAAPMVTNFLKVSPYLCGPVATGGPEPGAVDRAGVGCCGNCMTIRGARAVGL